MVGKEGSLVLNLTFLWYFFLYQNLYILPLPLSLSPPSFLPSLFLSLFSLLFSSFFSQPIPLRFSLLLFFAIANLWRYKNIFWRLIKHVTRSFNVFFEHSCVPHVVNCIGNKEQRKRSSWSLARRSSIKNKIKSTTCNMRSTES